MFSLWSVISSNPRQLAWLLALVVLALLAKGAIQYFTSGRGFGRTTRVSLEDLDLYSKPVLSAGETKFLRSIEEAVGGRYLICPELPLWTFVETRTSHRRAAGTFRNRISLKRVDFCLVDRHTSTVRMVIELDDRSHQREDRQSRDVFVEKVLKQAGVPLVRIPAARAYDPKAIRATLGLEGADGGEKKLA